VIGTQFGQIRSFSGRLWRDRLDEAGRARALAMVQQHGIADVIARILAGRGVEPPQVPEFLEPKLRTLLPDPDSLRDMAAAAGRLADAVQRGESVAVFGDYDVDGAASAALLAGYLMRAGVPVRIHIPDRLTEGYGPNVEAIRMLAREATLLVTVDCGTTSDEPLAEARGLGLDTIVLDHHQAPVALPPALAIVNPNRQDDLSGLGHLCAAGVVFVTLVALNRELRRRGFWAGREEPDLRESLDLVALGTVADVVPLTGLNRAFVRQGLAVMKARGRLGLRALADVARLDGPPRPYHLGYLLGPRINAGGRIGDAALGARLLLGEDETEAANIAGELDRLNGERQAIEQIMLAEAEAMALADLERFGDEHPVLFVASGGWHPGVVGLVAARLKERFERPAFALALGDDGLATGSARSVQGVDLGRAVRHAVEAGLARKGGGHAMAAGLTVEAARIGEIAAHLAEALRADVSLARQNRALTIDSIVTAGGCSTELVHQIEAAGPFGAGHPEPVILLPNHRVADVGEVGRGHVRATLRAGDGSTLNAIAFRMADQPLGLGLMRARGEAVHVCGHLAVDRWNGRERVQLRILDAAPAGIGPPEVSRQRPAVPST
jgi:single-stranded-DNA-specific exonuclease